MADVATLATAVDVAVECWVTVLLTLVTLLLKVLALLRSVAWLSSLVESLVLRLLDSVAT